MLETFQFGSLHNFGIVPGDICLFHNARKERTVEEQASGYDDASEQSL